MPFSRPASARKLFLHRVAHAGKPANGEEYPEHSFSTYGLSYFSVYFCENVLALSWYILYAISACRAGKGESRMAISRIQ